MTWGGGGGGGTPFHVTPSGRQTGGERQRNVSESCSPIVRTGVILLRKKNVCCTPE